jgi:quercetin dioxygenase-like cupin family protein
MPKMSKESAPSVDDAGPALDQSGELDGYMVEFVTIRQGHSLAGLFTGLPGDRCPCPHFGYLFKGRLTVTYADREEIYEAGDAFIMSPGHVPAAETGSEFVQFSPADEAAKVYAVIKTNAQAMRGA